MELLFQGARSDDTVLPCLLGVCWRITRSHTPPRCCDVVCSLPGTPTSFAASGGLWCDGVSGPVLGPATPGGMDGQVRFPALPTLSRRFNSVNTVGTVVGETYAEQHGHLEAPL